MVDLTQAGPVSASHGGQRRYTSSFGCGEAAVGVGEAVDQAGDPRRGDDGQSAGGVVGVRDPGGPAGLAAVQEICVQHEARWRKLLAVLQRSAPVRRGLFTEIGSPVKDEPGRTQLFANAINLSSGDLPQNDALI